MDSKFNTSFIPKKSLQADTGSSSGDKYVSRRTTHYGPGFFLTFLIFVASVVASIGVFGYTTIVNKQIDEYKKTLDEQQNKFDSAVVDELIRAESRIENAKDLVVNHTILTQLLSKLEAITLRRIQYTELTYVDETDAQPLLTLLGIAESYKSVAQQTTVFRNDNLIHNPIMVELEKSNDTDDVTFALEASVDEKLISFSATLAEDRFGRNAFVNGANTSTSVNASGATTVNTGNTTVTTGNGNTSVTTDNATVDVTGNGANVIVNDGATETVVNTSN